MSPAPHERPEGEVAAELVRRIRAGDAAAEGELVTRYRRGLLAFLHRQGADLQAEDLQQETFQVALVRLRREGLEEPGRLSAFLLGTARHLAMAERRKFQRRQTFADDDALQEAADAAPDQLSRTLEREGSSLVRRLIEQLQPERDRHLLYRFYVAEESKETLCDEWGLTALQFNRVIFRARQRFKELLEAS